MAAQAKTQIARSTAKVGNARTGARQNFLERPRGGPAPGDITSQRKEVVEKVITMRYRGKHAARGANHPTLRPAHRGKPWRRSPPGRPASPELCQCLPAKPNGSFLLPLSY